ncbi:ATP-binding protein [Flammeovirga aprica]|uniref:ATP-binding protein n=1 Tax=Flammeovirga aprica JL-4 TaxID=694437 RepID=A0A7X9P373_9BACT|nr:ATP-binding protein [Flammeovirga aprica]NME67784.1 ATP-binding protein [Flammeovirga aprica JL-4]
MQTINIQPEGITTEDLSEALKACVDVLSMHIRYTIDQYSVEKEANDQDVQFATPDIDHFEAITHQFPGSYLFQLDKKLNLNKDDLILLIFAYAWEYKHEIFTPFFISSDDINLINDFPGGLDQEKKRFTPFFRAFLNLYFPEATEQMFLYFTSEDHPFIKNDVISFEYLFSKDKIYGKMSSVIKITEHFVVFLHGGKYPPLDSEIGFPAKLATSSMEFDEVVLTNGTKESLDPFITWLRIQDKVKGQKEQPFYKKIKTNKMYVFAGPPGTGKTLTATTLGKRYGLSTYTLDISRVVSKYIGEFEKAMERVFQKLDGQDAILFIDEADALFTKRSENINDAKDKYSNQEMSYLLQRVERFDGIVILATNVRDIRTHFDKAMLRRISEIIEFGFPLQSERLQLWSNAITPPFNFKEGILEKLSEEFQVTGANIASAMSNVIIECIDKDIYEIDQTLIEKHLQKEYFKRDSKFGICRDSAPAGLLMEQRLGRTAVHTGSRM